MKGKEWRNKDEGKSDGGDGRHSEMPVSSIKLGW
jgi:hypothetical protein